MPSTTRKRSSHELTVVRPHAAGIDLGAHEHYVAVDASVDPEPVRRFSADTPSLMAMGAWLKSCGVTTVAVESTGVYWRSVVAILESEFDVEVFLVDAHQVRSVAGRKTDLKDCQWLQRLHSFGLLSAAFRAPKEIEGIKTYFRQRKALIESCATHINRMHKALDVMNLRLSGVLSDISGQTGMAIIRDIVKGVRDPAKLARHRKGMVKKSYEEIAKALTGNYLPEQVFVLSQQLAAYDFCQGQIEQCDEAIEAAMQLLETRMGGDSGKQMPARQTRRKNQAHFDLRSELVRISGVDLTAIPGISELTAFTFIAEVGVDVSKFPTEKHFASWLALCPNHVITGGSVRRRRTRPGANRVASALRVAAQSLHRSQTALGALYRRQRAKLGAPKAITAVAHKLAVLMYRLLKHGTAFVELGLEADELRHRQRSIENVRRNAKRWGFALTPLEVS